MNIASGLGRKNTRGRGQLNQVRMLLDPEEGRGQQREGLSV